MGRNRLRVSDRTRSDAAHRSDQAVTCSSNYGAIADSRSGACGAQRAGAGRLRRISRASEVEEVSYSR